MPTLLGAHVMQKSIGDCAVVSASVEYLKAWWIGLHASSGSGSLMLMYVCIHLLP